MPYQSHFIKIIIPSFDPKYEMNVSVDGNLHELSNKRCNKPIKAIYERISIGTKRNYRTIGIICPECQKIALLENVALIDPITYRNKLNKNYQYNWPKKQNQGDEKKNAKKNRVR